MILEPSIGIWLVENKSPIKRGRYYAAWREKKVMPEEYIKQIEGAYPSAPEIQPKPITIEIPKIDRLSYPCCGDKKKEASNGTV